MRERFSGRIFMISFLLLAFLAGCTADRTPLALNETETVIPATKKPALTSTSTTSPSSTVSPVVQFTLTSTPTAMPQTHTVTPTFDITSIRSVTPNPPATCPVENPDLVPDFDFTLLPQPLFRQVIKYLNSGGMRQTVITAFHQYDPKGNSHLIQEIDVTADRVPELLIIDGPFFSIFACSNGRYEEHALFIGARLSFPRILHIEDMNLDGILEIIAIRGDLRWHPVEIFSWDGAGFRLLNVPEKWLESVSCSSLLGYDSLVSIEDTNSNGLLELVLKQGIPIWTEYVDGLPWRPETRICAWNGVRFVLIDVQIDGPPEYRFQAVQDGDRAVLAGDLDVALELYREAIDNEQLEWWSRARYIYERNAESSQEGIRPTLDPTMQPDPLEYAFLAAYAHYRIMLLYVQRGELAEAQAEFDALWQGFTSGKPGHAHAQMATAFWMEYQKSMDIGQACTEAVRYAAAHPNEILTYLGNSDYSDVFFGEQSLSYTPESVCPFR
jgi:hypothetical protein